MIDSAGRRSADAIRRAALRSRDLPERRDVGGVAGRALARRFDDDRDAGDGRVREQLTERVGADQPRADVLVAVAERAAAVLGVIRVYERQPVRRRTPRPARPASRSCRPASRDRARRPTRGTCRSRRRATDGGRPRRSIRRAPRPGPASDRPPPALGSTSRRGPPVGHRGVEQRQQRVVELPVRRRGVLGVDRAAGVEHHRAGSDHGASAQRMIERHRRTAYRLLGRRSEIDQQRCVDEGQHVALGAAGGERLVLGRITRSTAPIRADCSRRPARRRRRSRRCTATPPAPAHPRPARAHRSASSFVAPSGSGAGCRVRRDCCGICGMGMSVRA